MRLSHKRSSGSAIVAVLLVVAVISIIAVGLMVQQRIDIRRTQQLQTADQAYRYSQAVLFWAIGAVKMAQDDSEEDSDELWQRNFPPTKVAHDRGETRGHLERLDQRFNLNAIKEDDAKDLLTLLVNSRAQLSESELLEIIANINAWVAQAPSDSDDHYALLTPPYRAAHAPMVSPTESRLVVGIDANTYQQLLPYIIALPSKKVKNKDYYLLTTEVTLDDQRLRVYSILHQQGGPPKTKVTVVQSTRGTW